VRVLWWQTTVRNESDDWMLRLHHRPTTSLRRRGLSGMPVTAAETISTSSYPFPTRILGAAADAETSKPDSSFLVLRSEDRATFEKVRFTAAMTAKCLSEKAHPLRPTEMGTAAATSTEKSSVLEYKTR